MKEPDLTNNSEPGNLLRDITNEFNHILDLLSKPRHQKRSNTTAD